MSEIEYVLEFLTIHELVPNNMDKFRSAIAVDPSRSADCKFSSSGTLNLYSQKATGYRDCYFFTNLMKIHFAARIESRKQLILANETKTMFYTLRNIHFAAHSPTFKDVIYLGGAAKFVQDILEQECDLFRVCGRVVQDGDTIHITAQAYNMVYLVTVKNVLKDMSTYYNSFFSFQLSTNRDDQRVFHKSTVRAWVSFSSKVICHHEREREFPLM